MADGIPGSGKDPGQLSNLQSDPRWLDGSSLDGSKQWDLNLRPLGYEPDENSNYNNLQDAGGYLKSL
jgi:hypothetical protein